MIKEKNIDINVFSSSIRLYNRLKEIQLSECQAELFLDCLEVHCFKRGIEMEDFVDQISNISTYCNKTEYLLSNYSRRS